jgi:hypothetical protein
MTVASLGRVFRIDNVSLDARIHRLPGREVDVELAPRLRLRDRPGKEDLELVRATLLGDALCTHQELAQVVEQPGTATRCETATRS